MPLAVGSACVALSNLATVSLRLFGRLGLGHQRASLVVGSYPRAAEMLATSKSHSLDDLLSLDALGATSALCAERVSIADFPNGHRMKFVCLLPVRDEADIIGQCLQQLLEWASAVYVFDTGSVDNTWEIVQDFAGRDARVKPLKKEPVFFSETRLRGWMFNEARQGLANGDWFLRVDADEFHHISPPEFVETRLRRHETIAYHQYYNFCLLEAEVRDWETGRESLADRTRPIGERRRWYELSAYSEPRLCRYRRTMQWPPTVSFPFNAGYVAAERLPIRHYPHRDPVQLERRCRLRAVMMADKENRQNWSRPELHHWAEGEWRKFITPDAQANLKYWAPGTEFVESRSAQHLARPLKRTAQRIAHSLLLPLLDRFRSAWPAEAYPQRIPPEMAAQLAEVLNSP